MYFHHLISDVVSLLTPEWPKYQNVFLKAKKMIEKSILVNGKKSHQHVFIQN